MEISFNSKKHPKLQTHKPNPNVFKPTQTPDTQPNSNAVSDIKLVNSNLLNHQKTYKQKIIGESAKVMQQDPNIYEYDAIYDQIKAKSHEQMAVTKLIQKKDQKREPKYMNELMEAHERRKREQTIMWENIEGKERIREDKELGETEKFFTPSFQELMKMKEKYQKIQKLEESYNANHTANNQQFGMLNFYQGLLSKNKSMGGGEK